MQNDNTEMYSMHNEEKSFVSEKLIKTLKNKIIKNTKFISMKKNGKKKKKEFRVENVIQRKGDKYIWKGKNTIIAG